MQIGPGTGNLTKHLLSRGAIVTAVEKDDTLYARLLEEYKDVSVGGVRSVRSLGCVKNGILYARLLGEYKDMSVEGVGGVKVLRHTCEVVGFPL